MKAEQIEITKEMIDEVIKKLPTRYTRKLAEMRYGQVSPTEIRRIKNWRAGQMKDRYESKKIFSTAQKFAQKCEQELAEFQSK